MAAVPTNVAGHAQAIHDNMVELGARCGAACPKVPTQDLDKLAGRRPAEGWLAKVAPSLLEEIREAVGHPQPISQLGARR